MKLRNLILALALSAGVLASCRQEKEYPGIPQLSISKDTLAFDMSGGILGLDVAATRGWAVESDIDWIAVTPENSSLSAEPLPVMVTALENSFFDRTASVRFSIGMLGKNLVVTQKGPLGYPVVYANDFDRTEAVKGDSWTTYLASFDGWRNEDPKGSGHQTVTYGYDGKLSVRTNSGNGSAGSYSVYPGSGMNYLWFGTGVPYFLVRDITLREGLNDYELSFGTERYEYNASDNTFDFNEFNVYISADGEKWVRPAFKFDGGAAPNGQWDRASALFTLPEGTETLSVYFVSSVASAYAIDDLRLEVSAKSGQEIDFSTGVELVIGQATGGGAPVSSGKKTVQEFINAADKTNYYELTGTVSSFSSTYCSFDLTDASGSIYVYSVLDASKSVWASKIKNGGTVTILGKYDYYSSKSQHEVVDAYIVSFTEGSGSGPGADSGKGDIFSETFASGIGDFTIVDKTLPSALTEIWKHHPDYSCMIATGYHSESSANHASESWLVSPEIDLTSATSAYLSYEQACNFFSSVDVLPSQAVAMITKDGGQNWDVLSPEYPATLGWVFEGSGDIDLSAYLGNKVKLAFMYVSTAEKAGTWELKNVMVSSSASSAPVAPGGTSGDGTEANPYTVADVITIFNANNDVEMKGVWVTGPVLGTLEGSKGDLHVGAGGESNTNIAIGTSASYVPVQLPKGTVRDELNLVDHPEHAGKTVKLKGTIQKYFLMGGLKNVSAYSFSN